MGNFSQYSSALFSDDGYNGKMDHEGPKLGADFVTIVIFFEDRVSTQL